MISNQDVIPTNEMSHKILNKYLQEEVKELLQLELQPESSV